MRTIAPRRERSGRTVGTPTAVSGPAVTGPTHNASTGPRTAHGRGNPQARIYRRRDGEPWQPLAGGLPEPLPAMPYALLASDGRLFAGLANGELWESRDRGDSWTAMRLEGGALIAVLALASERLPVVLHG